MDEIEVSIEQEKKEEPQVSFVEHENETVVTIGEPKSESSSNRSEDERIRAGEVHQARLQADLADLRSRLAGGHSAPQSGPATDPWKAQEDTITERERALGIQWEAHKAARSLSPELLEKFDKESRELQQRRTDIAAERAISRAMPQFMAASQANQYATEYHDVRSNANANRWARGRYDMLLAQGAPDSPDTVRQAMNDARVQFRLGGARSSPTDQDRQQLSGYSANGRLNMSPKNNVVKMGKSEKIMAMSMYGDAVKGDEKKAYALWAKGPGIRAQKAMQKSRQTSR
jgi:hypothetical protein